MILCGASSVGKSTLAQLWCSKHPEYDHIQEIARDIMKDKSIERKHLEQSLASKDKTVFLQLQYDIIDEQNRREADLIAKKVPFISDRGPDPYVYIDMYCTRGKLRDFSAHSSFVHCLERYRNELLCFVLCPLRLPNDDGVRLVQSMPEQLDYNHRLCKMLQENGVPFVYIHERDLNKRLLILEDAMKRYKFSLQEINTVASGKPRFNIPLHLDPPSPTINAIIFQIRIINTHTVQNLSTAVPPPKTKSVSVVIEVQTSFSSYSKGQTNRMLERYDRKLVSISFDSKLQPSFVRSILRPGILINGIEHNFLGCSSSGLKDRTCYVFKGTKEQVKNVREECGDFSKISSRSKYLKRIGMLFSEVKLIEVNIDEKDVKTVDDVENKNGDIFTDGCGQFGEELARKVNEEIPSKDYSLEHYLPSVYQIRYQGCKGVVAISNDHNDKDKLVIRESMKKFNSGLKPFPKLGLCDFSKPYSYGHLNKQFIMLLSGLKVSSDVFLEKQKKHFEILENMLSDPEIAIMVCYWKNSPGLAARIANCPTLDTFNTNSVVKQELHQLQNRLMVNVEKKKQARVKIKLRILVPESRNIFGICDPIGVLEYGQCFVRPTIRGKPQTITGKVTVGKNPCYLLGDIRVLEAVDDCRLNHLVDCIVFPIKGKRPHPSEIAGSDLDGDQYFVSWDKDLIPPTIAEPYGYPSVESKDSVKVTDDSMIDYFSQQSNQTGKIDSYYMFWASRKGVTSNECQELGKLFSRSVDATKTGDIVKIPHYLVPGKEDFRLWQENIGCSKDSSHVWERLEYNVMQEDKKFKENLIDTLVNSEDKDDIPVSESFIKDLVDYRAVGINEYQIFFIIRKWCLSRFINDREAHEKVMELSEGLNFSKFTTDEKLLAIDCGISTELITNALNWSTILTPSMKNHFYLVDSHCYWNLYFHADSSDFKWQHLLHGLLNHKESMIILQLANEIVFIVHFLSQLRLGQQDLAPGSAITYFFSPHFDLHLRRVLGSGYCVNMNEELLQLYQGNIRNTFMWIKSESQSKEVKAEVEYDRVSVDLNRFKQNIGELGHPRVNKESYTAIECFVKDSKEEVGYFDIYEAHQPDSLTPVLIEDSTAIEELPFEYVPRTVEYNVSQKLMEPYQTEVAISCLKDSSFVCDCKAFLLILQTAISNNDKDLMLSSVTVGHFIHLLTNMATNYLPFPLPQDVLERLQVILISLCECTTVSPLNGLTIINRLCLLRCPELISEAFIKSITTSGFRDCCNCMVDWSLWACIPINMAHHLVDTIVGLYRSQQPSCSHNTPSIQEVIHSTESPDSPIRCNKMEKEQYVCKFLELAVKYFITEVNNMNSREKIHQSGISMLKAYEHNTASSKTIQSNDKTKSTMGFRSTGGRIAPNVFKQGGYVVISSMVKSTVTNTAETPPISDDCHIDYIPIAIGQIVEFSRHPTNLVVEIIGPAPACLKRSASLDKGHWRLQVLGNVTAFKRTCDALLQVLKIDNGVIPAVVYSTCCQGNHHGNNDDGVSQHQGIIMADSPLEPNLELNVEKIDTDKTVGIDSSDFNDSQQRAIKASLNNRLTLIHGPPGTGKTHVACEIVRLVCKQNKGTNSNPVLVTAETNMAVDNLTIKLNALGLRVVRVGGDGHISNNVRPLTLEHQVETKRIELSKKKSGHGFPDKGLTKKILKAAEVIATTCTGAGDSILKDFKFNFVIIDEATLATEPTTIMPIVHDCQQLTLIGDPQQLAPSLLTATTDDSLSGLKRTLFHRLNDILPAHFLNRQYRMHPALMDFPSNNFYNGRLVAAVEAVDRSLPDSILSTLPTLIENPVLFINTNEKERRIGTSYVNQTEVNLIEKLVIVLLKSNIAPSDIVVITPYIGQVHALKDALPNSLDTCISTIDSFQGRERDIVVFSSVRCNSNYRIGFMDDMFRVNVLLTRAKCALIGVGSKETLTNGSDVWKRWFTNVKTVNEAELMAVVEGNSSSTNTKTKGTPKEVAGSKFQHQQKRRPNQRPKDEVIVRKVKSKPKY